MDFLSAAQNLVGIPYERGGSSLEGLDCYGLIEIFYLRVFGMELDLVPDEENPLDTNFSRLSALFEEIPVFAHSSSIPYHQSFSQDGDILCFLIPDYSGKRRKLFHAGVIVDKYFFHSDIKVGVVLHDFETYRYRKFLARKYRLKKEAREKIK